MKTGLLWKEWRQNAWLLIVFLFIIIGFSVNDARNSITSHYDELAYYQSDAFKEDQQSHDFEMSSTDVNNRLSIKTYNTSNYIEVAYIFSLLIGLKITVFEKNKRMDGLHCAGNALY